MRPLVAVVIVLALVIAAAAIGFVSGPPRQDASASAERGAAAPAPSSTPAPAASPPTPPARSRPGKVLPLADAMKELDLIKPVRAKTAEDFSLPMPGGGTFKLAEHRGKVVMINFWATWCPPCLEEMPAMERLYRKQKDTGFTMVAISWRSAATGTAISFCSSPRLTMPWTDANRLRAEMPSSSLLHFGKHFASGW